MCRSRIPSASRPTGHSAFATPELQKLVDGLRQNDKVDAVVLLSHNGMDVDLKLASRVTGIDVILGGHTHDAVPQPVAVANAGGKTLVTNAGSSGKFLGVLDLELGKGAVKDVRYHLLPVYAGLLKPDPAMQALIDRVQRSRMRPRLREKLAVAGDLLYRRGNFNGTMDQLICDALRHELDAELALSPGFRWGNTLLPGEPITMDDMLSETAITYPEVYVQEMTGAQIKAIMEDICDNLFNPDPYYQQGGDMVRIGGMDYACAPAEAGRQTHFRPDARQRQDARSRQDLQGRRLGLGQSASRQAGVGGVRQLSAPRENREAEETQSGRAQRRVKQSGDFRLEDAHVRGVDRLHGLGAAAGMAACRAFVAALACRAQTRSRCRTSRSPSIISCCSSPTARQTSRRWSSASPTIFLKAYDPDKIAIEVVAFGPGIDLLRAESPNRARVDSLISQGVRFDVCMNTVDTIERETGKHVDLNPKAVRGAGRRRPHSGIDRERLHAGASMSHREK